MPSIRSPRDPSQASSAQQDDLTTPPLPYHARWFGLFLLGVGSLLVVLRFHWGIKLSCLNLPVFALHATYFKARQFQSFRTDLSDEVAWSTLLIGTTILALCRRREESIDLVRIRLRALLWGLFLETTLLAIAAFTFFGMSFVYVLVVVAICPPTLFLIVFRYLLWRRDVDERTNRTYAPFPSTVDEDASTNCALSRRGVGAVTPQS